MLKFFNTKAGAYLMLGIVGLVVLYFIFYQTKKAASAAVTGAGNLLTGNNDLTKGTVYQGAGVAGTLGAAANDISGGTLGDIGEKAGGAIYDFFHPADSGSTDSSSSNNVAASTSGQSNIFGF